jgi:hypothetical protein
MARRPCPFSQGDVTRAIRGVEAAGKKVRKVEIRIIIDIAQDDDTTTGDSDQNVEITPEKLMKLL